VNNASNPLGRISKDTIRSLVRQVRLYIDPLSGDCKASPPEQEDPRFTVVPHTYVSGTELAAWPGKVTRFREKWGQRPPEVQQAILTLAFPSEYSVET
jgi:hypothetical protein